jgi:hypothetical protein
MEKKKDKIKLKIEYIGLMKNGIKIEKKTVNKKENNNSTIVSLGK